MVFTNNYFMKFNTTCKNSTGYCQVSCFIWIILSDNCHIHGSVAVERYYRNCFLYTHMKDVWSSDEQLSIAEKNNKNINKRRNEWTNQIHSFNYFRNTLKLNNPFENWTKRFCVKRISLCYICCRGKLLSFGLIKPQPKAIPNYNVIATISWAFVASNRVTHCISLEIKNCCCRLCAF